MTPVKPSDESSGRQRASATSHSLIADLKDNQALAWKRLVHLYEPLVRFWSIKKGFPREELSDLVQDVFQTVVKSIESFSIERESDTFRGWLKTITHSRMVDWYRRNQGKPTATGGSTAQLRFHDIPFDSDKNRTDDEDVDEENRLTRQLYLRALEIIRDRFQEQTWQAFWRVVIDGKNAQGCRSRDGDATRRGSRCQIPGVTSVAAGTRRLDRFEFVVVCSRATADQVATKTVQILVIDCLDLLGG